MIFGRNYDWITATGVVNSNLRGLLKTSLPPAEGDKFQWVSKYGSITFNQYGKEFPTGGMNETGLVVELMWLDESKFPEADKRPSLSVLQWIQYQLDNSGSVDEVIASDKKVRINSVSTPQHYLVADGKGKVATIEFLNGKMKVHSGNNLPFPVLANSTYEKSTAAVKAVSADGKSASVNFQDNSIQRFAKTCKMVQQYQQSNTNKPVIDYAFDILSEVAQGSFTKWSIVYDITNKQIIFKTEPHQQLKKLSFSSFDFSCKAIPQQLNMNQNLTGDVRNNFAQYSNETNSKFLRQAFEQSKPQLTIKDESINAMVETAASVRCNQR